MFCFNACNGLFQTAKESYPLRTRHLGFMETVNSLASFGKLGHRKTRLRQSRKLPSSIRLVALRV
jgi:hypothetical protein